MAEKSTPNAKNSQETNNKKDQDKLKNQVKKAQSEYVESNLDSNIFYFKNKWFHFSDFSDFVNNNSSFKDVSNHLEWIDNENTKSTYLSEIKAIAWNIFIPREKLISRADKSVQDNFELTGEQKTEVLKFLQTCKAWDLIKFTESSVEQVKVLNKEKIILKENLVEKKRVLFLDKINFSQERINAIKNNPEILSAIENFSSLRQTSFFDFKKLIDFLNKDEKIKLFKYYFDQASVADLVGMDIITNQQADAIIEEQIQDQLDEFYETEAEKKAAISSLDKKAFYISTAKIVSEDIINRLSSWVEFQWKILEDINKLKIEAAGENYDWFTKKINPDDGEKSLIQAIESDSKISEKIKVEIAKLKKWAHIVYETNINGETHRVIMEIDNTDLWNFRESKALSYKDISKWENGIVSDSSSVSTSKMLYKNFYDTLLKITEDENKWKFLIFKDKQDLLDDKNIKINSLSEENEINSKEELHYWLNEIDSEWRNVDINKMSFVTNEWSDKETVYSTRITENGVLIEDTNEEISFMDFFSHFNNLECNRFHKSITSTEVFQNISQSSSDMSGYKDLMVTTTGRVINEKEKDTNSDEQQYYECFVGEWSEAIYITKIDDGSVEFSFGEYQEKSPVKKKDKDKFDWKQNYKWWDDFYYLMNKFKLQPKESVDFPVKDDKEEEGFNKKKSFLKWFLHNASVSELLWASKQILDSIETKLSHWNKLKSAKLALSMWRIFGKESDIYTDMQSLVEQEEKKTMEELVSTLKWLDSKVMIPKIEKILECSNSEQYEIEAALMATLKYGTLYPKALKKNRWKFVRYEALGGKQNDKLYKETKAKCEDAAAASSGKQAPVPFTEELLVEMLLSKQARWDLRPKRRSKIHKEFWAILQNGIKDEKEDGALKTSNSMTAKWRLRYAVDVLAWGELPNALGWLENIRWKNGSAKDMHSLSFIITMTWVSQNFDQNSLNGFIWSAFETPYAFAAFNQNKNTLWTFQKVVEQVVQESWNSKMQADFTAMMKASYTEEKNDENQIWLSYHFWDKYGDSLVQTLMCNDGIIPGKMNEEWYENYKKYFWTIEWVFNDDEYNLKKDFISNGVTKPWNTPIYVTGSKRAFKKTVSFLPNWKMPSEGEKMIKQALSQMGSVKDMTELNWIPLTEEMKKETFSRLYSTIYGVIRKEKGSGNDNAVVVQMLKKFGFDFNEFNPDIHVAGKYNTDDLEYGYINTPEFKEFVDKKWKLYLQWDLIESNTIEKVQKSTNEEIINFINFWSANEENYSETKKTA